MVFFVLLGFAAAFVLLPSLHSHPLDLSPASVSITRTAHFSEAYVSSPSAGVTQRVRVYPSAPFVDIVYSVSMARRANQEIVVRFAFSSFVAESDDGVHMDTYVPDTKAPLTRRTQTRWLLVPGSRAAELLPTHFTPPRDGGKNIGVYILRTEPWLRRAALWYRSEATQEVCSKAEVVFCSLPARLLQDDEQGLDAPIDDTEEPAQLHFRLAPNGDSQLGLRLNSPLRAYAQAPASVTHAQSLLAVLTGFELLHAVALPANSLGLLYAAQTDECIDDAGLVRILGQLNARCLAAPSDATFAKADPSGCRRHFASYVVSCSA